jgi:Tfp pilus assembly protein PilV
VAVVNKTIRKYKKNKQSSAEQGFGILEASIALTTLGITLAYAMPLFLYSKMNNSKSEIRTGGMMVAQRILDKTRGTPFADICSTGTVVLSSTAATDTCQAGATLGSIRADLRAMGRDYTAQTFHCEIIAPATISDCSTNYKTLRVEVKQGGAKIYEMSAGFTNFR